MIDVHQTIDAFRRGALDLDCTKMVLQQRKENGPRFEGPGYIRQSEDGTLLFKLYVEGKDKADQTVIFAMLLGGGELFQENELYDLMATSIDGTTWTAARIVAPRPSWDMQDDVGLLSGNLHSIIANPVPPPKTCHLLRLHFFEEYEVPLHLWTPVMDRSPEYGVRDRAEFEACGAKFSVQKRVGSGDTVVEARSETPFLPAFDLRIQEALQYLTEKSAIWRARLETKNGPSVLELASPRPKALRTRFEPPISPGSSDFESHGWLLFNRYLEYVVRNTHPEPEGLWNAVAYHLYNARESTSASIDAWAVGVSVAVEAVVSLTNPTDQETDGKWTAFRKRMLGWIDGQLDIVEHIKKRARGLIGASAGKGAKQKLRELAENGYVDQECINAWDAVRNRHIHPNLADLRVPGPPEYRELFIRLWRVGTLLHQLTFHLIGYEGPFTDYGRPGLVSRRYPLPTRIEAAEESSTSSDSIQSERLKP